MVVVIWLTRASRRHVKRPRDSRPGSANGLCPSSSSGSGCARLRLGPIMCKARSPHARGGPARFDSARQSRRPLLGTAAGGA